MTEQPRLVSIDLTHLVEAALTRGARSSDPHRIRSDAPDAEAAGHEARPPRRPANR
jgi:hypothetical protein